MCCTMGICCSCCGECEGQRFGLISRIPYIFLFFIAGIFSIVMSLYGTTALNLEFYTSSICTSSTCSGNGSVYRVSCILFIFELIHVVVIGCGAISFHWLCFLLKFIIFTICLTLTFVVGDSTHSNQFFQGYADYFARFVSGIYLLLQILIFILYGYKINDYLQEKGNAQSSVSSLSSIDTETKNNSCNRYFVFLGVTTFGLYAISLTFCCLFFKWYALDKSCSFEKILVSLTIVMLTLNFIISAVRGDGSLFVSAIVSFYITFLCFSALQSSSDERCNTFANNRNSASLWIGFVFLFIAIFYFALIADRIGVLWEKNDNEYIFVDGSVNNIELSISDQFDKQSRKSGKDKKPENEESVLCEDESNIIANDGNEASERTQRISNTYFHLILTLSACYFAMLLTDWGAGTLRSAADGKQSMIVNITTQCVTVVLFWWTVLAPVICPKRFNQTESESF